MKDKKTFYLSAFFTLVLYLHFTTLVLSISQFDYFNMILALAACSVFICAILISNDNNREYNKTIDKNLKFFKYQAEIFARPEFAKFSKTNCQRAYDLGRK